MSKAVGYISVLESILSLLKEEIKPETVECLYGYPLRYCPNDLIIQCLEEDEACPELASISFMIKLRQELSRREDLGIIIKSLKRKK